MDEAVKAHLPADKALVAVFSDKNSAESAYRFLKELGYPEDEINVLMSDETRTMYFDAPYMQVEVVGASPKESPAIATAVGTGTGVLLGAALGAASTLVFPGVGLVIAGPISAALIGAGFGGMTGGLMGSLIGVGVPEPRAKAYEEKVKEGKIILGVNPRNAEEEQQIIEMWRKEGGDLILQ
jgi:hypothetical protein